MATDWLRYVETRYWSDLEALRAALGYPPDRKVIEICDANLEHLSAALRTAGLSGSEPFVVVLTLEATLLAGIHAYDVTGYSRYVDALPHVIYVEAHGTGGVLRPHLLLSLLGAWTASQTSLLAGAAKALLPRWTDAYDSLVGRPGAGRAILERLAEDRDLGRNPYDQLAPDAVGALPAVLRAVLAEIHRA